MDSSEDFNQFKWDTTKKFKPKFNGIKGGQKFS